MTDQVSRLDVVATDNVSAAMNAAAASLDKVATSADSVTTSTTRAGRSAESFVRQNDAVSKAAAALAKALSDQAAQAKAFADATDQGRAKTEEFARATETMEAKVASARAKLAEAKATTADFSGATVDSVSVMKRAAESHNALEAAARTNSYAFRELSIQASQAFSGILTGQPIFTTLMQQGHQVADTMLSTGQGMSFFSGAASKAMSIVAGLINPMTLLIGAAVAVGVALYEMTKAGNTSLGMLASISVQLRGTRDDYAALGQTVLDVARKVSGSSGLGLEEAVKAAQTLASAKYFSGTARDLEALTRDAENLGVMMGGTDAAAKALAEGMQDPTKAAEALSATFSRTLTPELLNQITLTQKAGDYNKAYTLLLGGLRAGAGDAARDGLSPLARAWQDLGNAFTGSTAGWRPFMEWLANTAAKAIDGITASVTAMAGAFKALGSIPAFVRAQASGGTLLDNDGMPVGSASGQAGGSAVPASLGTAATKDAFVAQWTAAAAQAGAALGVSPSVLLAQWGMETGWGKSAYNNNAGNIKPGADYAGNTFTNPGDGQAYRSYMDPMAFATDFVNVLQQKWPGAKGTGSDAAAYAAALGAGKPGGYATDPNYASKLTASASSLDGGVSAGTVANQKAYNDELAKSIQAAREFTGLKLDAEYANIQTKLQDEAAAHGTDTAAYRALTQEAEKNTAARYANVDAMTAAQRGSDSAIRANKGLTSAEQELSAAIEARRQVALAAGQAFTKQDEAQVVNNVLQQQSQAYARNADEVKRATDAQVAMTAAYESGSGAVVASTVQQQAYAATIQEYPRDAALFGRALDENIARYAKLASATKDTATAQQNLQIGKDIAYIQAETASLGQNEAARARDLAVLKATQEKVSEYGTTDLPLVARQYIALKAATADASSEFQHQQNTLQEVSGFFSSTFDTISSAITQAFATGQLQALKFKDIMSSVISAVISEFAKLAILNPLKNMLFGTSSTTLTDVGGLIGSLFGGGAATTAATAVAGAATGTSVNAVAQLAPVATAAVAGAQTSPVSAVGSVALSGVDSIIGKLSGGAFTSIGGLGSWIVGGITSALGNATQATNIALAAAGEGVSGVATASQVGAASLASAAGFSDATAGVISSAAGTVANALPAIGAAVSVITDLIMGNYRGAGLIATGAIIGTFFGPIGTAVGAAVGGLVDAFLPTHPLHPFENTELNIQDGHLQSGKTVGQLADTAGLQAETQGYADSINKYLDSVSVRIANADGNLGAIGQGITGLAQTLDPNTLFSKLAFTNDAADTSQFGVAKGALQGMSFANPQALADELQKIAGFADATATLGITLASVGKDISAIRIASVSGLNPDATSTVSDSTGRQVTYKSDLRTALNADLPAQTFADTTALNTEMQKVSDFITGTLPALLTPVKATSSTLQDSIQASNQRYADAEAQSKSYGLNNDDALNAARDRSIAILMQPALDALNTTLTSIAGRGQTALYGQSGSAQATAANLAQTQNNERSSLYDTIHQTFGDGEVAADNYARALQSLIVTQNAETEAAKLSANVAQTGALASIAASSLDYAKRAGVDTEQAALQNQDAQANAERATFIQSWVSYFGQAVTATQAFQDQLSLVDQAHYKERLALQATFVGQYSIADRNATGQAVTSLTTYARGLQSSSASPLSTQDQYALASSQFNAVQGAARAGDYSSVQQLQSYADAFLSASRNLNGSGAAYATDFNQVLDALNNVATTNADTLTASYMASIAQGQTDQLVAELQALRAEVAALRTETQQATTAPARVAA